MKLEKRSVAEPLNSRVETSRNSAIFGKGRPRPPTPELERHRTDSTSAEETLSQQMGAVKLDEPERELDSGYRGSENQQPYSYSYSPRERLEFEGYREGEGDGYYQGGEDPPDHDPDYYQPEPEPQLAPDDSPR